MSRAVDRTECGSKDGHFNSARSCCFGNSLPECYRRYQAKIAWINHRKYFSFAFFRVYGNIKWQHLDQRCDWFARSIRFRWLCTPFTCFWPLPEWKHRWMRIDRWTKYLAVWCCRHSNVRRRSLFFRSSTLFFLKTVYFYYSISCFSAFTCCPTYRTELSWISCDTLKLVGGKLVSVYRNKSNGRWRTCLCCWCQR